MTHSYVRQDSFVRFQDKVICVTWQCHLCVIRQHHTRDMWLHYTCDMWQRHSCDEAFHTCTYTLSMLNQCVRHSFLKAPQHACCLDALNILHSLLFLLLLFWPESRFYLPSSTRRCLQAVLCFAKKCVGCAWTSMCVCACAYLYLCVCVGVYAYCIYALTRAHTQICK